MKENDTLLSAVKIAQSGLRGFSGRVIKDKGCKTVKDTIAPVYSFPALHVITGSLVSTQTECHGNAAPP